MRRRGLTEETVHTVLEKPEQGWEVRRGRHVFQSRISMRKPEGTYLVRVFVDVNRKPPEVVTAYRTSKIEKYWRDDL
jgi:hypothetical protein